MRARHTHTHARTRANETKIFVDETLKDFFLLARLLCCTFEVVVVVLWCVGGVCVPQHKKK